MADDSPPSIRVTTLPGGLRVATEHLPGALSVSAGVWVSVGARDEPAEQAGVSHFLEHLLFKGTATRSARDIAETVDRVGGEMNAFTTKEYTAYYCRMPAHRVGLAVELLGDVLSHPALRDADVECERQVILEELAMDEDTHEDKVHALLQESLFPGHPLGRETAGRRDRVTEISPADVRAFFGHWYRPANTVLSVAGNVEHDEVVELASRWFPAGEAGPGEAPQRSGPSTPVRPLAVARRGSEQAHVALGWRGLPRRHPRREALDVMNHVLGGGMSSRLFDEIREQRGLAYAVYSAAGSYTDAGSFMIYAGTSADRVDEVLDLVDAELAKLAARGISVDELEVAKGYLAGSYLLGLEDPTSRMGRTGAQLAVSGSLVPVEEQVRRYEAVTAADVRAVVDTVLAGPRSLAVVGPVTKKRLLPRVA